jgi:hypothetical protein
MSIRSISIRIGSIRISDGYWGVDRYSLRWSCLSGGLFVIFIVACLVRSFACNCVDQSLFECLPDIFVGEYCADTANNGSEYCLQGAKPLRRENVGVFEYDKNNGNNENNYDKSDKSDEQA